MVRSFGECEGLVKSGIPLFEIFATSLFKNLTLRPPVESSSGVKGTSWTRDRKVHLRGGAFATPGPATVLFNSSASVYLRAAWRGMTDTFVAKGGT
jgi:hypothetical protein